MSKISGVIAILFMAALAAAASAVAAAASPVFNINLEYFNFLPHDDQNDPYVLYSEKLPENLNFAPTLGNGHLGFTMFGDAIFVNGIYNGDHNNSHRARVPNYANIKVTPINFKDPVQISYSMNVRNGIFQIRQDSDEFAVRQVIYPHRYYNRIIIHEVFIEQFGLQDSNSHFEIETNDGNDTVDLALDLYNSGDNVDVLKGFTTVLENSDLHRTKTPICIMKTEYANHKVNLNTYRDFKYYQRVIISIDKECSVAKADFLKGKYSSPVELIQRQQSAWEMFWDSFNVNVDGNLELNQVIKAGIYAIASSLPHDEQYAKKPFVSYGISPTGIGRGDDNDRDYKGHSFWDTEIWMFPVIQQMNPKWARHLLNYRYRMLDGAKYTAEITGYSGARYPWESAFTGSEVTDPGYDEQVHIAADISFAARQYLAQTFDKDWFHREGCTLVKEIARFWESRVTWNATTEKYDIDDLLGPDEYHWHINNNVYTNVLAAYALKFGDLARATCDNNVFAYVQDAPWTKIADKIEILYDKKLDYHPQYSGYTQDIKIKQADTILLGYPLQYPMEPSTRKNDLIHYENVTSPTGPAMTWSMHSINNLDIGNKTKADENFENCYKKYVTDEFKIWSEVPVGRYGGANFITGVGGFLQALINGYAGVRVHFGYMEVKSGFVPASVKSLTVSGVKYLGSSFELQVGVNNSTIIICTSSSDEHPLILVDGETKMKFSAGSQYQIHAGRNIRVERMGKFSL